MDGAHLAVRPTSCRHIIATLLQPYQDPQFPPNARPLSPLLPIPLVLPKPPHCPLSPLCCPWLGPGLLLGLVWAAPLASPGLRSWLRLGFTAGFAWASQLASHWSSRPASRTP